MVQEQLAKKIEIIDIRLLITEIKILTYFFSLINFYKVSDIASCYWLIETEVLKNLDIKEKGFAIEVEVLSKFLRGGTKYLKFQ